MQITHKHIDGYFTLPNGIKIYPYEIYRNSTKIEDTIFGWKTALAHARKWKTDLFCNVHRIEIVNKFTGEVLTLEEAEKRAAEYARKR